MTNLKTQQAEFEAKLLTTHDCDYKPVAESMMQHIRQQAELIEELVEALKVGHCNDEECKACTALATAEQQGFGG